MCLSSSFSQDKHAIQLQQQFDFEVANHFGAFINSCIYFIFTESSTKFNSLNIRTITLFHSDELKKYGFVVVVVLRPMVDELMILETEGTHTALSDTPLRGTILQVTG